MKSANLSEENIIFSLYSRLKEINYSLEERKHQRCLRQQWNWSLLLLECFSQISQTVLSFTKISKCEIIRNSNISHQILPKSYVLSCSTISLYLYTLIIVYFHLFWGSDINLILKWNSIKFPKLWKSNIRVIKVSSGCTENLTSTKGHI